MCQNTCITDGFSEWTNLTGQGWGRFFVGPIQFGLCYGAVIACILLGGQSLKVGLSFFPIGLLINCHFNLIIMYEGFTEWYARSIAIS